MHSPKSYRRASVVLPVHSRVKMHQNTGLEITSCCKDGGNQKHNKTRNVTAFLLVYKFQKIQVGQAPMFPTHDIPKIWQAVREFAFLACHYRG